MAKRGWRGNENNMASRQGGNSQSFRDQKITVKREFVSALAQVSHLSVPEIAAVAESNDLPALHVLMGKIVLDAIEGNHHARTFLLDRLFGKVADAVDVCHSLEIDPELARIPEEKLIEILELSEATNDTVPRDDQRGKDSVPGEAEAGELPTARSDRVHNSTTGTTEGLCESTEPQRHGGETNHGRQGRYKGSFMEVGDTLLEARFPSEKYKGDASKD